MNGPEIASLSREDLEGTLAQLTELLKQKLGA